MAIVPANGDTTPLVVEGDVERRLHEIISDGHRLAEVWRWALAPE